jgi:Cof subfamily protein (haloacid dehalogenase superfamily)
MTYRLIAFDVDNTLVRFPDPPSKRVTEAVQAVVQGGTSVVLVTGRAFRRARPVAQALGLNTPIVCNHGGSIRDAVDGSVIYRKTMPRPFTAQVVRWLRDRQVCLFLFDGDVVYHDCRTDQVVPDFQVYTRGEQSVFVKDLNRHIPEETEIVLSTSSNREHLARVYQDAQGRFGAAARVMFSHPNGVDILPHSGKAEALAWLAERLGVPREEVMAVGDGENDVDMLAWAGLGVAMEDGDAAALAAADVIAPPFDRDGAAWAVERYISSPQFCL